MAGAEDSDNGPTADGEDAEPAGSTWVPDHRFLRAMAVLMPPPPAYPGVLPGAPGLAPGAGVGGAAAQAQAAADHANALAGAAGAAAALLVRTADLPTQSLARLLL